LRVSEQTHKFESGQLSRHAELNIDSKSEYSKNIVTQIARILRGWKCDVYVVFLPLVADSCRINKCKCLFLREKKCGRPWGRIIAVSKIKDLVRNQSRFHGYSTTRGFGGGSAEDQPWTIHRGRGVGNGARCGQRANCQWPGARFRRGRRTDAFRRPKLVAPESQSQDERASQRGTEAGARFLRPTYPGAVGTLKGSHEDIVRSIYL
jgi:hypothetical protein